MSSVELLAESPSLNIHRVEGGWLILLPSGEVPIACETASHVLQHVGTFLGVSEDSPTMRFGRRRDCPTGASIIVSKITNGYLISQPCQSNTPLPPGAVSAHPQAVRFRPLDVVIDVVSWLGLAPDEEEEEVEEEYEEEGEEPGWTS